MEKKTIKYTVDLGANSTYLEVQSEDGRWIQDINTLIEYLQKLKSKGATHIEADFGETEWSQEKFNSTEIEGIYYKTESDEDFKARMEEEKNKEFYRKELEFERKRQDYLKLKQIFEPK